MKLKDTAGSGARGVRVQEECVREAADLFFQPFRQKSTVREFRDSLLCSDTSLQATSLDTSTTPSLFRRVRRSLPRQRLLRRVR